MGCLSEGLDPSRHRGAGIARPVGHAGVALDLLHRQMTGHRHDLVDGAAALRQVGQAALAKAVRRAEKNVTLAGEIQRYSARSLPPM